MSRRMYRTLHGQYIWHILKTEGGGECAVESEEKLTGRNIILSRDTERYARASVCNAAALLVHPSCVARHEGVAERPSLRDRRRETGGEVYTA